MEAANARTCKDTKNERGCVGIPELRECLFEDTRNEGGHAGIPEKRENMYGDTRNKGTSQM